ncbi:MAG: hypothetical protein K0Q57_222 [Gammaproteobacteria bacterium]|nr:hypothetical protein [Gammaproteobacteria bacterium]
MLSDCLIFFRQLKNAKNMQPNVISINPELCLKNSSVNLSKLNSQVKTAREYLSQIAVIANFLVGIHPVHAKFLPFINSGMSVLVDKLANKLVSYKIEEFRQIVSECTLKHSNLVGREAMLKEISQLILSKDLPEPAKEILREAAFAINTQNIISLELAMQQQLNHHHSVEDWGVEEAVGA